MEEENLESISINLVKNYFDDEYCFKDSAERLANYFYENDRIDLARYVRAQFDDTFCLSTMEPDPLPNIAKDMYKVIELIYGKDNEITKDFRNRLAFYINEFMEIYK